jgi:hypothetical protein
MNKHINKIKLPLHIQRVLSNLFESVGIDNYLKEDSWIAGGFPRIVSENIDKDLKTFTSSIKFYFKNFGDIDVFSKSIEKVNCFRDKIIEDVYKRKTQKENIICEEFYCDQPFSFNYEKISHEFLKFNLEENDANYIKTQFVNKFIFNNISECFDNFDFSNSKLAIAKEKNEYVLYYTDSAEFYNRNNILNIERVSSPLLSSRVCKYNKKYGFKIENNTAFRESIREYILKIISNTWPKVLIENNSYDEYQLIEKLHNTITLEKEDLCLLLGKFTCIIKNRNFSNLNYGIYYRSKKEVDWAAHEMSK